MKIKSDWHIHTHCSCDSACMEFETLVQEAKELGIRDFGVSDHFHTRVNEPDIAASRREYEATIERHPELKGHFHFGMEATVISAWEVGKIARGEYTELPVYGFRAGGPSHAPVMMDYDADFLERYKIEYVVAGVHWPMYCPTDAQSLIKEYHRQYMFAATHPSTTILAHYLWWDEGLLPNFWHVTDVVNPFLDFSVISESMRGELKAALLEHHTALEINFCMTLKPTLPDTFKDEYLGWMAELQRSGVVLAMGGDCHRAHLTDMEYNRLDQMLHRYGIDPSQFFCL